MEISIELLAFGLPIILGVIFMIFLTLIKYYRLWRYKPENDKGKLAEDNRLGRTVKGDGVGDSDKQTTRIPKRRSLFSLSSFDRVGGDKKSVSKPSGINRKTRNTFIRRIKCG